MIVGCGEWGFRNVAMEEHFRISRRFGFKFLEFGIGGGQPGRLPEEPTEADVAEFRALGERYGINTPFSVSKMTSPWPAAMNMTRWWRRC